ncbi:hypothetical protein L596_021758 [Steinernema carpocapsae]|uniref:DUF19 domain-containing protein n=1 Tax=Steinernema carpocapsae TaxID=34508 RepID=A0A4U5MJP3_STECR|nr:hypothetical protein L596_021758 [Steinernema carpocapsae]
MTRLSHLALFLIFASLSAATSASTLLERSQDEIGPGYHSAKLSPIPREPGSRRHHEEVTLNGHLNLDNEDNEDVHIYRADECDSSHFVAFQNQYERRCAQENFYKAHKNATFQELKESWLNQYEEEEHCHFFTEVRLYLEKNNRVPSNKIGKCMRLYLDYAKVYDCLVEVEKDKMNFAANDACIRKLKGRDPLGYVKCRRKLAEHRCPRNAMRLLCDKEIAVIRPLQSFTQIKDTEMVKLYTYCATVARETAQPRTRRFF